MSDVAFFFPASPSLAGVLLLRLVVTVFTVQVASDAASGTSGTKRRLDHWEFKLWWSVITGMMVWGRLL